MGDIRIPNSPSPAEMPRRAARCEHPRGTHSPKRWVVVETLIAGRQPTVVLDGKYPRRFANVQRVTVAPNVVIARRLEPLVARCIETRRNEVDRTQLACGAQIQIVADPILGPYGDIRAVALWAGSADEALPPRPTLGVVEWDAAVVVAASRSARSLLLDDDPSEGLVLPEVLARFDRFDDRSEFLSLFRLADPKDQWVGCATRTFSDGVQHQLHIVARACDIGVERSVRAIMCDVTDTRPPDRPEMYSKAMRHVPIPPGHALALIDLKALVVHDWLANSRDPIAGWRHHQPLLHPDDQATLVDICRELLSGARETASMRARLRFDPADEWIWLEASWTRVLSGDQPQALVDIAVLAPIPPSVVDNCPRCQGLSEDA